MHCIYIFITTHDAITVVMLQQLMVPVSIPGYLGLRFGDRGSGFRSVYKNNRIHRFMLGMFSPSGSRAIQTSHG